MPSSEYYEQLRIRRAELLKQVEMIEALLADEPRPQVIAAPAQKVPTMTRTKYSVQTRLPEGRPKGEMSYDEYIIFILAAVFKGEKVTSAQVRDYAYNANPDINQETLNDAIRSGMSSLGKADRINVTVRSNRKLGHLYSAKPEDIQRLAA